MPKPDEVAEVVVNGRSLREWKTVLVKAAYGSRREFNFKVSEGAPFVTNFAALPIKPGDAVTVNLAGQLACTGYVNVRQVIYNAELHGVMIQGRSRTQDIIDSSAVQKGGQFRGYKFEAIARKVLQPFGIELTVRGGADADAPFKDVQIQPGESVYNFLDRLARMRGLVLNEDERGNLVAAASPDGAVMDTLVEGVNIRACRMTLDDQDMANPVVAIGQYGGNDQEWGKRVAQPSATATNPNVTRYRPFLFLAERAADRRDLQTRADYEVRWRGAVLVNGEIEVKGWLTSGGILWKPGAQVFVRSPMIPMAQNLAIQSVTFTQDNDSGTLTTLELVRPEFLGGRVADLSSGDFSPQPVPPAVPDKDFTQNAPR